MPKSEATIAAVVNSGLCTGCGACVALCPRQTIELAIDKDKGIYLPHLDEGNCNKCGVCFEVCPGHSVDFTKLNLDVFGKEPEDRLIGNCVNCYAGYAADHQTRYNAASGGLVTALLVSALEECLIDGALVTKMRDDRPLEPQPFIARTREEVVSAARSKYCPVPANIALREIAAHEGKFAVVGLPCHIHAIRKAEAANKKLKDRITLHLGLFCCGHTDTFLGTEFVLHKYGIAKEDVAKLDYRGEGWPGHMKVVLKNGTTRLIFLHDYIIYHNFGFFSPTRCALCYDGTNDLCDISLGDAWLPEFRSDKVGTSVAISRTASGEAVLQRAMEKGTVVLNSIDRSRARHLDQKKPACGMKLWMGRLLGRKTPRYGVALPRIGFVFPPPPVFYLCMCLSARRYWWIVDPLARSLNLGVTLGKKILRR